MRFQSISKNGAIGIACTALTAVLLVACGGGEQATPTATERVQGLASTKVMVTWSPASVSQIVKRGEARTATLTLTATKATPSASLRVVPEIAPYVSVTPATIEPLVAGQSVMVILTIAVPAATNAPSINANGTLQLRTADASGNTLAKPLSVQVIVPEVINGIAVPAEPDPVTNNATLAGVDSNANGIRDDVERVLAREFGSSQAMYSEAFSFAVAEQAVIVLPSSATIAAYTRAVDCSTMSSKELNKATYALLNIQLRRNAYATANAGTVGGACK